MMPRFVQITMNDISFGVSLVQNAYPFLVLLQKHERPL